MAKVYIIRNRSSEPTRSLKNGSGVFAKRIKRQPKAGPVTITRANGDGTGTRHVVACDRSRFAALGMAYEKPEF